MRELPVRLSPMTLQRRGSITREIVFFLVAFCAMFGGAYLALDMILQAVRAK